VDTGKVHKILSKEVLNGIMVLTIDYLKKE